MISFAYNYLCGIYLIDEQHKILCDIINNMQSHKNLADENDTHMIEEIRKYSAYHFESEEAFWSQNSEEEIMLHKQLHKEFLQSIELFASEKKNQKEYEVFVQNLEMWIVEHITIEDKKMFRFESHIKK